MICRFFILNQFVWDWFQMLLKSHWKNTRSFLFIRHKRSTIAVYCSYESKTKFSASISVLKFTILWKHLFRLIDLIKLSARIFAISSILLHFIGNYFILLNNILIKLIKIPNYLLIAIKFQIFKYIIYFKFLMSNFENEKCCMGQWCDWNIYSVKNFIMLLPV